MSRTKATRPTDRIIRFLGCADSGEYGNASCPHCGAAGRYVYSFEVLTETGEIRQRGAMAGCIKLFPVSPVADAHAKIMQKAKVNEKKAWNAFNRWDTKKLEAIEAFYAGTITEDDALLVIREQTRQCKAWVAKKYGGRR